MEYYYKAVEFTQQKDYATAIEVFDTALTEYPDSFMLLSGRALNYNLKGDKEKAIEDFTRMIAVRPESPDGWNGRGNLYHELGEYDKAIADFTQCIPLSPPNYGSYWSNRGISYYEKGDLKAALSDLNTSIKCWDEPESTSFARGYRRLVLKKMVELGMDPVSNYDLDADDVFYQEGYTWFMQQDYDQAIECFSKAIAARDDYADNWMARGVCYWNQCVRSKANFWSEEGKIMDLAIDDFTKAIECDPDMSEAYFDRGMVRCAKAQDSNNLIKSVAMQKVSDSAQQLLLLAQLEHIGGKDFVPQVDAFLRSLRSNRDQADVLIAQSVGLLATDDAEEAIEDLSQAIDIDPKYTEAYYYRGIAYSLLGKKNEAISDYEQTCVLNPDHHKAMEKLHKLLENQA
jgi:tetratricopeptide (TPR) repeat protein